MPPLLAGLRPLDERYAPRIVKDHLCGLEIAPMFVQIALVLPLVPFKAQYPYVQISTYIPHPPSDEAKGNRLLEAVVLGDAIDTCREIKAKSPKYSEVLDGIAGRIRTTEIDYVIRVGN